MSEKTTFTSKVETENKLAEETQGMNSPTFTYLNKGEPHEENEIEENGTTYKPLNGEELEKGAVILPGQTRQYESEKKLLKQIRTHIHKYVDLDEKYEKLASWYIMMTWVYDELHTVPYLRAFGDTGTGKSRFLDVIGKICYKPIMISGAATPAPVFRLLEKWKGTLMIDEGDLKQSDEKNPLVKILNCGFERNKPVMRCDKDQPDTIETHRVFGPKVISTRKRFHDKALESRCLTHTMQETDRTDIPVELPKDFYMEQSEIREKLLRYRLENKKKINRTKGQKVDLLKGKIEPRIRQSVRGFATVFHHNDEILGEIRAFLKEHQKELITERSTTWEGQIANTIYDILREEETVKNVKISSKKISERGENEKLTPQRVGQRLKTLNIETERKRYEPDDKNKKVRRSVIVFDKGKLKKLFRRYVEEFMEEEKKFDSWFDFLTNQDNNVDGVDGLDGEYGGEVDGLDGVDGEGESESGGSPKGSVQSVQCIQDENTGSEGGGSNQHLEVIKFLRSEDEKRVDI